MNGVPLTFNANQAKTRFSARMTCIAIAVAVALTSNFALAQINEATTQPPPTPKPRFPQLPDDNVDIPRPNSPGDPNTIVAPKEGEFVGRLEKVEGRVLSFKPNDAAKLEATVQTVTVAPNAKVTLNREPAQLKDLSPTDFVRVKTTPGDSTIAVEIAAARVIRDTPPADPKAGPLRPQAEPKDPLPSQQGGLGLVVIDSPQVGVLILDVKRDTPAWTSGIQTGDYLMQVAGTEIVTPVDFLTTVRQHAPRESVQIMLWRKGKPIKGDVVLTTREVADDREAEDGRALIVSETHGDDTVVIKRTPGRTEGLDREPEQSTVVLDREPDGSAVVIDPVRVETIPKDYEELAKEYRVLLDRIQRLERQIKVQPNN